MPNKQKITDQNIGTFQTIYENYQVNPAFYENHEQSAELLNAVKLYEAHLASQQPPEIKEQPTPSRFLPEFMQPEPRQDIYRMGEGLKQAEVGEGSKMTKRIMKGVGRVRTQLPPDQEQQFQEAWQTNPNIVEWKIGLGGADKSPDDPQEQYDYRKAWLSGDLPEINPLDGKYHWGSIGKDPDHPTYNKQFSVANMIPLNPGDEIDYGNNKFSVKARKLNGLQKAVNSYVSGAYDLVDLVGGGLVMAGLEESGTRIRDFAKDVKADYRVPELEKTFEWSDMADPTFYYTKGVRMIPMLTTIIPTAIGGGAVGGGIATWLGASRGVISVTAAVSSAVAARPIESGMEAIGTYNEMIDEGESKEKAGEAASSVFLQNLALIGMDAAQYALAFAKVPAPLRKGMAEWIKRSGIKAAGFAAASVSEGYEEVLQNYFQEFGKASARGETGVEELKALLLATPEAKEAFVLGSMAGVGFQVAGQISGGEAEGKLSENELDKLIEEQIITMEVNDGVGTAEDKEQKLVDALNVGLEKSGLGITKPEEKIEEPTTVKADIEAKPIQAEPTAVKEKAEPVKPIEKPTEKVVVEKPAKATTENIDEFLGEKTELGKLGKDDAGYFVEKADAKERIAPSQAVSYVNEKIKPVEKPAPTKPKIAEKYKTEYDKAIESIPEEIKKDINVKSVSEVTFDLEHEGSGGKVFIDDKGEYHILIEKGEKDIAGTLRHELLHIASLNTTNPELLKIKKRGGYFGEEDAVKHLEKQLKTAEKPKEAPIVPKEAEKPAEAKLPAKKTIIEPTVKEDKQLFTEIVKDIESQIDISLKVSNTKDIFDAGKNLVFDIKSGENYTVVDNKIKIKSPQGEYEFTVPTTKAELKDLKSTLTEAFKKEQPIRVTTVPKRKPVLESLKVLQDKTAPPKRVEAAKAFLKEKGIGYKTADKVHFSGIANSSKKVAEENKIGGSISGVVGTLPTPKSDYSGVFEMPELTKFEKFRAFWDESNIRLQTLNTQVEKIAGNSIDENLNVYMLKDMLPRVESDVSRRVGNEKRAYVLDLIEKKLEPSEIGDLAWAEHAIERNRIMNERRAEIKKEPIEGLSGMTNEKAQTIIDKATPAQKKETAKLRKMYNDLLTESVNLGLTTPELAEAYKSTYDNYVALFRDMDSDNISGIGSGVDIRGEESKKAKGSLRDVHNPIANYFYTKERLRIRALKNEIGLTINELTNENSFLKDLFEIRKTPKRSVGKVEHKAAVDLQFQTELMDFAKTIGLEEFKVEGKIGNVFGYYVEGKRKIVKRLGAGRETEAHEVGHFISEILRDKYNFKGEFKGEIAQEIQKHSALKGETEATVEEKWANAFSWWMTHRGQAEETMPLFDKRLRDIIDKNTELKPLLNIRPTPKLEIESITQDVFSEYFPLGNNEIGFKKDGKQYFIKINDANIAKALKNVDLVKIPHGLRRFRLAIGFMSSMKTKYSPEFLLSNFERDLGEALMNLGVERHMLGKKGKGLRRAIVKDLFPSQREIYKYMKEAHDKAVVPEKHLAVDEFFRLGGDVGKYWLQDISKTEKTLKQIQDEITGEGINQLMNPLKKVDQLIDAAQSAVELGIRYATYKQLVSRGMGKKTAIQSVADLTVNFSRQGNFSPALKSAYMFIGPAIQGTSKIARVLFTRRGSKALATKLGAAVGALASLGFIVRMLSSMMDPDGDEQIPDFTKNHKIALSYNGNTYQFWNMPYGYVSFYSIGNNVAEMLLDRKTFPEALGSILETTVNSFSPWGTSLYDFIPALIKPLVEIKGNQGWYGGPVYPPQPYTLTPNPDHETYFKNTGKSAIFATKLLYTMTGIDIHPNSLEYALNQYFGGPFTFSMDVYEAAARGLKGEFDPNKTPFVKQVYKHGKPERWSYKTIYDTLERAKKPMTAMEEDRFYRAVNVGVEEGFFGDTIEKRIKKGNGFVQKFIRAKYKMEGDIFYIENLIKLFQMEELDRYRLIGTYSPQTQEKLIKTIKLAIKK